MAQSWRIEQDHSDKATARYPLSVSVSALPESQQRVSASMTDSLGAYTPITYNVTTNNASPGNTYRTELVLNRTPQQFTINQPAVQCQRCKREISLKNESDIRFNSHSYHSYCFNCTRCNRRLDDPQKANYTVHVDGEPLCSQCEVATAKVCFACQRPIIGERSITFDEKNYHTNCFRCGQCRKELLDEKGLHKHDLKPCCGDCFNQNFAPRCSQCSKPIGTGEVTVYNTKKYHPECFRCGQCHQVMTDREFFTRDSKPCCTTCYNQRFAEQCAQCHKLISDGKSTIYNTKAYHPDCLRCGQCHQVMTDREFFTRDSKPCCMTCYNQHFVEECAQCHKPISDEKSIIYNTKAYHPDCLSCGQCYKVLGDEKKCFNHDSKPCCNQCYNDRIAPRCSKCSKPIINNCNTFQGKNYHADCFVCANCHRVIGSAEKFYQDKLDFLCLRCGA